MMLCILNVQSLSNPLIKSDIALHILQLHRLETLHPYRLNRIPYSINSFGTSMLSNCQSNTVSFYC